MRPCNTLPVSLNCSREQTHKTEINHSTSNTTQNWTYTARFWRTPTLVFWTRSCWAGRVLAVVVIVAGGDWWVVWWGGGAGRCFSWTDRNRTECKLGGRATSRVAAWRFTCNWSLDPAWARLFRAPASCCSLPFSLSPAGLLVGTYDCRPSYCTPVAADFEKTRWLFVLLYFWFHIYRIRR